MMLLSKKNINSFIKMLFVHHTELHMHVPRDAKLYEIRSTNEFVFNPGLRINVTLEHKLLMN